MFAVLMSVSTFTFVFSAGVAAAMLGLHFELTRQRAQRYEATFAQQAAIIDEQEATIGAYRESMAIAMADLALQPQDLGR
jgi:hypothetical protein